MVAGSTVALAASSCMVVVVMLIIATSEPNRAAARLPPPWDTSNVWEGPAVQRDGAPGSSIFVEGMIRQGDAAAAPRRRRYPVFFHIPKTGGTAVENIMKAEYGVKVGRFAFREGGEEGKYEVDKMNCYKYVPSDANANGRGCRRLPTDFDDARAAPTADTTCRPSPSCRRASRSCATRTRAS